MIYTKQNSRTLNLVSLILLVSLISTGLKCQSVSTIGEIYDFEINDIFHTKESGSTYSSGFVKYSNILISGKYYSANNNNVFYTRSIYTYYEGSDNPNGSFNSSVDTISYTNLNSLLGNIDSVYYSGNYNGRKVNLNQTQLYEDQYLDKYFIDGCGGKYGNLYYFVSDEGHVTRNDLNLLYFKKGLEEWGTPNYITSVENPNSKQYFKVYPNPASTELILDLGDLNNSPCTGIIYSITGKRIEQFSFLSIEKRQLDVSTLNKGLYIIQLNIDGDFYNARFVKN